MALDAFSIDFLQRKKELLIFSASWCSPCQVLHKELNNKNSLLNNAIKKYKVKKYDFDIDKNAVKQYNITSIPTFVILSNNKSEESRMIGLRGGINDLIVYVLNNE